MRYLRSLGLSLLLISATGVNALLAQTGAQAQDDPRPAPNRPAREGEGPFTRLIIRGATVIDGTGAPPRGPMDIVIEGNRIVDVVSVGVPHVPIDASSRPGNATREIDATGMYVLPGFVDLHVHQGTPQKAPDAEYYNKLWMAHGITTARGVPFASADWSLKEKMRSARNEITAPRMWVYLRPGMGWDRGPVRTPEQARAWVQFIAQRGADGVKLGLSNETPQVMAALLDEAKKFGLGSTAHLAQNIVARGRRT
jgi:imidazolonepropionase-like amidohydrolase